jgi:hypothetical protein
MAAPGKGGGSTATEGTGELVFGDGGAPTGGGTGGVAAIKSSCCYYCGIYWYNKYVTYFRFINYKIRYFNCK